MESLSLSHWQTQRGKSDALKTYNKMYKFGQIEIASKEFNSVYQIQKDVDLGKIRVSGGVVANKHDTRYTVGYEVESGKIIPLCIKTPRDCVSSGVGRYNEASPWKMGFNVSRDEAWMQHYRAIWVRVEELLNQTSGQQSCKLTGEPLSSGEYVNAKLITWDGEIRTGFRGTSREPEDIGILKIGSMYRQGSNYRLQVFLKEVKYRERDVIF